MIEIIPKLSSEKGLHVLCLGAHCDDIEIGCGGTLLKLIEAGAIESILWVVFASNPARKEEAKTSADRFLEKVDQKEIQILSFRDAFLWASAVEIKEHFEKIKTSFSPDVVFTHYRDDRHQDHRLISDYSWNTFRNHLILEYEIPKYDGDLGQPNTYVHLSESVVSKKISILLESFESQRGKHWFDEETFRSLLRIRGLESAAGDRYAEAFHARKMQLSI